MTRDGIVSILHDAEVIGCDPDARYLIAVNRELVPYAIAQQLGAVLREEFNLKVALLFVTGDPHEAIAALELKP